MFSSAIPIFDSRKSEKRPGLSRPSCKKQSEEYSVAVNLFMCEVAGSDEHSVYVFTCNEFPVDKESVDLKLALVIELGVDVGLLLGSML